MLFGGLTVPDLIARAIALLIAITIHEFAHAWMAFRLGDPTAKTMGRLSLNPLVHLDMLGTLMLLSAGFGWGKPVPVNPYNLRNGPKAGMAVTSLAGPVSNLILAGILALPLRFGLIPGRFGAADSLLPTVPELVLTIIFLNIVLAVFNLIPLPPLDGFKVAMGLLPSRIAAPLMRYQSYGPLLLLGIIAIGWITPFNPLWMIIRPFFNFFLGLFLGF